MKAMLTYDLNKVSDEERKQFKKELNDLGWKEVGSLTTTVQKEIGNSDLSNLKKFIEEKAKTLQVEAAYLAGTTQVKILP